MPQHNTTQHNTTNNHALIKFFSEWLKHESVFIFWMIILSITASRVNYSFFLKDYISVRTEFLIFSCDFAIISFLVVIIDLISYCLFYRLKFIHAFLKFFLIFIGICTFTADIFTIYYYNLPFNDVMFKIITQTNTRESIEFLQTYAVNLNLWLFVCVIAVAIYFIYRVFIFVSGHRLFLASLIFCLFCMGIFASSREIYTGRGSLRLINSVPLSRLSLLVVKHFQGIKEIQRMAGEKPEIILTRNSSTIPYVVFILGESTCRNHMSIYGYDLKTNPKLSERRIYVFDDTISPASVTGDSMQKIFTFCRNESSREWFTYADVFSILKAAGYYTVWLSNQENSSVWNVGGFYPYMCSYSEFTENLKEDMYRGSAYDEALLPVLDKTLNSNHEKSFYLIHLLGAHFHYHKRYPETFSVFSHQDEHGGIKGISESQKEIRARYDNAVLYNDYIINEIIRRFEDKNAIVIYISDHGEEVFDEMNFFGHGGSPVTRNMLEIPFIIWTSDKFSQAYPELEKRIASAIHRPYMTDDFIHTLLDIMSIETPEYDPARSIINESFDVTRPRIYSGHIYDKDTGLNALQ